MGVKHWPHQKLFQTQPLERISSIKSNLCEIMELGSMLHLLASDFKGVSYRFERGNETHHSTLMTEEGKWYELATVYQAVYVEDIFGN